MKKLIPSIIIVIILAGVSAWLVLNLRAKRKYDAMRNELVPPYSVVQMDEKMNAFLAQVQSDWTKGQDFVGGPIPKTFATVGLSATVSNLLGMYSYTMPEYSFVSPDRNKKAVLMGLIQGVSLSMSVDRTISVSTDHHLAMNRITTNQVQIYTDTAEGLREEYYFIKKVSNNTSENIRR